MDDADDATVEAIGISTDIAVRLIQGDHGSGNCWRVAQTLGVVIDYVRDLSTSGDGDSVDTAAELIDLIVTSLVYSVRLSEDEEINLEVQRNAQILDAILNEKPDESGEKDD